MFLVLLALGGFWQQYNQEKEQYAHFAEGFSATEKHALKVLKRLPAADLNRVVASMKSEKKESVISTISEKEQTVEEESLDDVIYRLRNSSQLSDGQFEAYLAVVMKIDQSPEYRFDAIYQLITFFDDEKKERKEKLYRHLLSLSDELNGDVEQLEAELMAEEESEELRQFLVQMFHPTQPSQVDTSDNAIDGEFEVE